ncbi:hypothetical protein FGG08_003726 [Glutinoglossum americanum]|uniref:Amidohydrolase-related domain-containing protein n=1 Tax=Glutinoglossum americanum TaxID=1670608 RepID=A0A9P8I3S3_9PEZI|nr:hypothetical protein FGG08_003726 [Glutinoglossum americanum]
MFGQTQFYQFLYARPTQLTCNHSLPNKLTLPSNPQEGVLEVARLFEQSRANKALLSKRRTPAELIQLMDDAMVSQICLCAWHRPGQVLFSNEEVAEFTRAYPDRIVGIAGVDLLNPMEAVRELRKYVREEGFKGLRYIDEIALKFPALRIICGHIGVPWTQEMIGVAWKHENVYIDTSAHLPKYYPPLSWEKCVQQVEVLGLRDRVRGDFLGGNARRVLKLGVGREKL